MRTRRAIAAAVLLAALAPAAGQDAARGQVEQLRARCAALQAEQAKLRKQIEALAARVNALQDELAGLKRGAGAAAPRPVLSRKLAIRVKPGGWGGANTTDITKVLESAAGEIWKHFPDRKLAPIIVEHGNSGPIVLYRKGPKGEHIVRLDIEGTYWCQFAYQFAHEFCHILTNYSPEDSEKNKWFCESLCEMASLYAIRRMAETWQTAPPYPHWKSFSRHLGTYTEEARIKPAQRLKAGATLGPWYRRNAGALRKDACLRDKNKVAASALLTLVEADPSAWRSVSMLNLGTPDAEDSFETFLGDWLARTSAKHKPFVRKVAALFEITLPAAPGSN